MRLSSQTGNTVKSPAITGLGGPVVGATDPTDLPWSPSSDTTYTDKFDCSESQLLGSLDTGQFNSVLLRAICSEKYPPFGGVLHLTKLTHLRRGSRRGRPARSRARPPQWGSVRVGSVCVAVAEATAGANRGRNHGRKQTPSHGGLTRPAALPPHPVRLAGPDRSESAVRGWAL